MNSTEGIHAIRICRFFSIPVPKIHSHDCFFPEWEFIIFHVKSLQETFTGQGEGLFQCFAETFLQNETDLDVNSSVWQIIRL